ncbi:condensation domain-containing protein [Micromonospora sp. CA-259024]|uniref:condensation domain-containing protein n=1 Tax=Micromonospora sp. CA-259024 TaxID=3239965 RepID=UPI003D8C74BE
MTRELPSVRPTLLQEALWWIGQRAKEPSVYNLTWRLAADRPIDVAALRAAYQQLVDRHDALRMSIHRHDDGLELRFAPRAEAAVRLIEVDDAGDAPSDALFREIADEVHAQPIPLNRLPLVSLVVVRIATRFELLVVAHHAAVDGWALNVLLDELSRAYGARVAGGVHEFPEPAPQFREYAEGQARAQAEKRWSASLEYWRKTLDGAVAVTVSPDRDRHAGVGAEGATRQYEFSARAARGITAAARRAGTTPFAVMLAALEVVLARGGGAGPDVVVGVVTANRMSRRDQGLVGYLANMCVARALVTADDTFDEVVGRARDGLWELLRHQAAPYPAVFAALPESLQTDLGGTAPVLLNYLGPVAELRLGPVGLSLRPSPGRSSRSDLALTYWDGAGVFAAEVEYSTSRYDESTVSALLADLDAVLSAADGEEPAALGSLRLVTRATTCRPGVDVDADRQLPSELSQSGAAALVSEVWTELLDHPPVDMEADFFASGGHSLNAVLFVSALAERTDTSLDLAAWLATPTPGQIIRQLVGTEPEQRERSSSTLLTVAEGSGHHLHLVGGAGGTPNDFRELVDALPSDWRVTWSQEREPLATVPEMARRYRKDLEAAGLRPDVLCGWSVGGLVGYEVAVQWGDAAPALLLLDSPPPTGEPVGATRTARELEAFTTMVCSSLDAPAGGAIPRVSGQDVTWVLRALAARLRAEGHAVTSEALLGRWDTYLRQSSAGAAYVSDAVVSTAAVLFHAELTSAEVDGWTPRLRPAARTYRVDSDHFGVLRGEHIRRAAVAVAELGRR